MDSLIYILFISIFFPLFLMMLLVEEKARLPIVFVLVGIFISVFASEVNGVLAEIANDMSAEPVDMGYRFDDLVTHTEKAMQVRHALKLGDQDLGRVIFSTDSEDEEAERNAQSAELDAFDRELARGRSQQSRYSDQASRSDARARNNHASGSGAI